MCQFRSNDLWLGYGVSISWFAIGKLDLFIGCESHYE